MKVIRAHKRSVPKTRNVGMRNGFSGAFDKCTGDCETSEEENMKFSVFHVQPVIALLKLFLGSRDLRLSFFIGHSRIHTLVRLARHWRLMKVQNYNENCDCPIVSPQHVIC